MKLCELTNGQRARVCGFTDGDRMYRQKLLQMGIHKGTTFEVVRRAPLGDPMEITCDGLLLTLRRDECSIVEVEPL